MGEIINLRRARKEREKRRQEAEAQSNRVAHGRAKSERELSESIARLEVDRFEAHRREYGDAPAWDDET
jgi:hypothetical protein